MKAYFVKSATSDNAIALVCEDGVRWSNCAPDGKFAGVSLWTGDDRSPETVVDEIRANSDPVDAWEYDWMGEPCYASEDEMFSANDAQAYYNQDEFFEI